MGVEEDKLTVDIAWLAVETMVGESWAADTLELVEVVLLVDNSAAVVEEDSTAAEVEVDKIAAEAEQEDKTFEDFSALNGCRVLVENCRTWPVDLNASALQMEVKTTVMSDRKNSNRSASMVPEANTSLRRVWSTSVSRRDRWNSIPNCPVSSLRDNLSDVVDRASSTREVRATKNPVQNIRTASD